MTRIKNISKVIQPSQGFNTVLLSDITFKIPSRQVASLIAPVGSGKSTLLRIIAGLETPTDGQVLFENSEKTVYIPSEASSFPWLNVYDNISFGLDHSNDAEIKELIKFVGLEGYDSFFPDNKSFGFRFRISLARSLAHKPDLILLDEPFNLMDIKTKLELYNLISEVNKSRGITFLLATSNISEAIFLSDTLFLMRTSPAEIISEIEIDLPSIRDASLLSSEIFNGIRIKVENVFRNTELQPHLSLFV